MPEMNDELIFAEQINALGPIIEKLNDLLRAGRINLKNQQYRIDNNHLMIVDQEKKIAQNKVLLDEAKNQADGIISVAKERAREIERGLQERVAEINHLDREAKNKLEEADRVLWGAKEKRPRGRPAKV